MISINFEKKEAINMYTFSEKSILHKRNSGHTGIIFPWHFEKFLQVKKARSIRFHGYCINSVHENMHMYLVTSLPTPPFPTKKGSFLCYPNLFVIFFFLFTFLRFLFCSSLLCCSKYVILCVRPLNTHAV